MINKYELVGIFGSIALMAVALYLLRVENSTVTALTNTGDNQAAVAVVALDNDEQGLFDTLASSVSENGTLTKLVVDDVNVGTGPEVKTGDTVEVNYIGTLTDGQEFDNSYNRGETFTFTVGEGRVIEGWELGLVGMQVGGKRILVIPPEMAYGSRDVGPIPANSTLMFAIELVSIK